MKLKRILAMFLCFAMVLSTMGPTVFAEDAAVAKVGNTEYATIEDAIANWTAGTTLTLLADVTLSDVITLSSTEYHILDLGTYTMTAASGKDAIQYVVNGRSSAGYALDIKADANNPGGITATGKAVISHIKPLSNAPSKDRPITRFYGGVFNASYVVKQGGTNNWGFLTSGYTGASAPYFYFYGGEFNGTIYTNRSQNQFHGGIFNGSMQMSVDSSAYTLIAGGTFKNLSNSMGSALNSDKFTIGSAKGVYDRSVYVDDNGNFVIASAEPATSVEASVAKTPGTNDYLAYSKVATEGKLNYTDVYTALNKNNSTSAEITVYVDELDMTGISYKGTIVVPEGQEIVIIVEEGTTPAWTVSADAATVIYTDTEGKVLEKDESSGSFVDPAPTETEAEVVVEGVDVEITPVDGVSDSFEITLAEGANWTDGDSVTMTFPAVEGASDGDMAYVMHEHGDNTYFYVGEVENGSITITNNVGFSTFTVNAGGFDEAIAEANTKTGDVTVEIYAKVEYTDATESLTGAYDSINFVGKTADAEICITRNGSNGYISGEGNDCKVTFTDLILSKAAGYFANDAGFMNVAFTVYRVSSVDYTGCQFPNGACATGCPTTYTDCTFEKSYDKYALWAYGTEVSVDECTFDDDRGIKMYAEGSAKTTELTVTNTDFSKLTAKPAIVATLGQSITLSGNTYSSKGVLELEDNGSSNGIEITSDDAVTCISDDYPNGCGVLVDGAIYRTVADAAKVAADGSTVTLLHDSAETVELSEGVTLDKNGFTADGVTVKVSVAAKIGDTYFETVQAAINAAQSGDTVEILPGEYDPINISSKNITVQGTVGDNGELLTTIKGGNPAIVGHSFNGTIKDLKIVDAWKVMYAEPAGNVTVDNVYVTGATYGFHLVAYSEGLTWTIQNSYMDLRWANSLGVYKDGDAEIIIKGNEFVSTDPYYSDYGALHVNSFLPNVTVEENIFRENAKIYIDASVTDTSNINISKNYHTDGIENAFADDSDGVTVKINSYYTVVEEDGTLSGLVEVVDPVAKIGDTTYETLEAAVAAVNEGETITMLADTTVSEDVTLPAGITFNGNGKKISRENGAIIYAGGELTFEGYTTIANFNANGKTINIGEGATLEATDGRMVIGHGATFNITGSIADAKTADVTNITPSLIAPGVSFTGAGVNFNVTNAYVKFTAYCSSKNSNANGTYNINVNNSIWEQTGSLVFSEPTNGMDPTFNFKVKDSVLNSTSHLVFAVTKGEIVFDNSVVNGGVYRQLENRSNLTIKNGSVVYAAHATSSNAKNPGTTIVENATYIATGDFSGSDVGTGTLIVKKGAIVNMGKITKANIVVDATGMVAGDVVGITANLSALEGTISVVNNNLDTEIVDGAIVLVEKPVAQIGSNYYDSLGKAISKAAVGDTVVLLTDVELSDTITIPTDKKITLDLSSKTITGTDNTEKNFSLIDNRGDLTITGNGTMTLTATVNSGWNRYSAVLANNPGGKLTIENGTFEHLGGTDMAYGIDNLTNGKGTYAETIINGGTIKSTYRGIRQFLNGIEAQNILTVNGGTVEGANKSIWMQDPNKNANTGTLTVTDGAALNGDVYLTVTEGSTEWPVEVSIAKSAVNGQVLTNGNEPAGYELVEENGTYGVREKEKVTPFKDAPLFLAGLPDETIDGVTYHPVYMATSVDSLNYQKVGFDYIFSIFDPETGEVTFSSPYTTETSEVYSSISDANTTYTVESIGGNGKFLFMNKLLFHKDYYHNSNTKITITPYAIDMNGNKICGWTFDMTNEFYKSLQSGDVKQDMFKEEN